MFIFMLHLPLQRQALCTALLTAPFDSKFGRLLERSEEGGKGGRGGGGGGGRGGIMSPGAGGY